MSDFAWLCVMLIVLAIIGVAGIITVVCITERNGE